MYDLTSSALDLGLIGLIQFIPSVVLTLLIGHAPTVTTAASSCAARRHYVLVAVMLTFAFSTGALTREFCLPRCSWIGCARAFEMRPRIRWHRRWYRYR